MVDQGGYGESDSTRGEGGQEARQVNRELPRNVELPGAGGQSGDHGRRIQCAPEKQVQEYKRGYFGGHNPGTGDRPGKEEFRRPQIRFTADQVSGQHGGIDPGQCQQVWHDQTGVIAINVLENETGKVKGIGDRFRICFQQFDQLGILHVREKREIDRQHQDHYSGPDQKTAPVKP